MTFKLYSFILNSGNNDYGLLLSKFIVWRGNLYDHTVWAYFKRGSLWRESGTVRPLGWLLPRIPGILIKGGTRFKPRIRQKGMSMSFKSCLSRCPHIDKWAKESINRPRMSVIYIVILPLDGVEIKLSPARQGNPLSLQKGRKDFYLPAAQGESPVNLAILTTQAKAQLRLPAAVPGGTRSVCHCFPAWMISRRNQ